MKKVLTLIVSVFVLTSAAWAEEDSYDTATERERIDVESDYKLKFDCECLPQADSGEPGLIVKVEVDEESTYFTIQSETMTMEELFKLELDWKEKAECSWDAVLSLDAAAKLGFQVEVDVGTLGDIANATAADIAGIDSDDDGKLSLDDVKAAAEDAVARGADPTVNKMEFQRPTRLSDEDQRDQYQSDENEAYEVR